MLSLLTGKPGSGKTVKAVDTILKIVNKQLPEMQHITNIYTNISGFKFELFEDSEVNLLKLDFKKLYLHLKLLHSIYLTNENKDNLDDLLIEYCKEHNIFNSYFIIDECQNHFESQDKVLMWWLTYHRHLHHEIMFITQNKDLINVKYRKIPEDFIDAQPRSKAIGKNTMRYFHYTDFAMTKKNQHNTTSLTVSSKHFETYKSGNTSNQKLVGRKYIYLFIAFIIAMVSVFTFLFSSIMPNTPNTNINETSNTENLKNEDTTNTNIEHEKEDILKDELSSLKYMKLKCNIKLNYCLYKNQKINMNFYLKMKELQNFQEISIAPYRNGFAYLEVFVTDTFYSIYNKDLENEKNTANSPDFFPTNN